MASLKEVQARKARRGYPSLAAVPTALGANRYPKGPAAAKATGSYKKPSAASTANWSQLAKLWQQKKLANTK